MRTVNEHEAKTKLSRLLDAVERGEEVVIVRAGRPIADLRPHAPRRRPLVIGGLADQIVYDDDDFDKVDPEIIAMFSGDDWAADDAG